MNGDFLGAFLLAIGSGELQNIVAFLVEGDGGAGSSIVHELRGTALGAGNQLPLGGDVAFCGQTVILHRTDELGTR